VEVYAREQILIHDDPEREIPLQAIRIGDLGIATFPNEVFGITGLKIKLQSPLTHTFNIELANGADGYIPPPEQHKLGGYTTWPARTAGLEPEAESKMVEALLSLLEKVAGKPRRPLEDAPNGYAKTVLAARPMAYWRMNDIQGSQALDATGGGHRAMYEDGIALYLDGAGQGNRAPHFAGGRMTAEPGDLGEHYSIALWFWNGLPVDLRPVTGYLFSRGDGEFVGIDGAGKLFLGSGGETLSGVTSVPVKTWTHVVLVRNGKGVEVYLNGNPTPEISGKQRPSGAAPLFIGGRHDNDSTFAGRIDEVAIFGRRLTAAEVKRLYAAAKL
jgi:hypothetical protein